MRVGVIGKTGSGKTTVAALVAMACASRGRRVVAVDTDRHPNLGLSLEVASGPTDAVPRALARGRAGGGVTVDQLLRRFTAATPSGVVLLHAMSASEEVGGCGCPAHASVRSLLASVLDEVFDVAVVDMEAGLDHLDRPDGTLAHADALLVVMDPSRKSLVTSGRMVDMARSGGISPVALVGNKASADDDAALFAGAAADLGVPLAGVVPFSSGVAEADRAGAGLAFEPGPLAVAVDRVVDWFLAAG